jgi:hypothetical protein
MLADAGYRHLGIAAPAGRQIDFLATQEADDAET